MLARLRCGSAVGMGLATGILYFDLPHDAAQQVGGATLCLSLSLSLALALALACRRLPPRPPGT